MESPIIKLRATEKMLEETRNELARTREELHNAKEEVKRLTPNSEPRCGIKKHNHFKLCSKRSSNCY